MANYLPVLLVSVSTNSTTKVPDDIALRTQPTAQVDYLSHNWEEEDVWRSWRNMTRQKKAIANGARLENASWRTWWKQRNKLGTVSPETLNWLKDSDVTWLYGPLHTAGDWKPAAARNESVTTPTIPSSTAPTRSNSPTSSSMTRPPRPALYKPILKHRSISQLLTSDFPPTSPVFSTEESDEDRNDEEEDQDTTTTTSSTSTTTNGPPPRPPLFHTKSDTHITRWGPNRAFRKESPPRVDPPGIDKHLQPTQSGSTHVSNSFRKINSSAPASSQHVSASGAIRSSISQDSTSSGSAGASSKERSHGKQKKKHISFNTFVEQCIAIEKPKKNASGYFGAIPEGAWVNTRMGWVDDDGYDEDQEDSGEDFTIDSPASKWDQHDSSGGVRAIRSDSDDEEEEDDDDDALQIRTNPSRPPVHGLKKKPSRSQSKVSTTSSSSSTTSTSSTTDNTTPSPSGSLSPCRRTSSSSNIPHKTSSSSLYRRSSYSNLHPPTSTYRPSFNRAPRPSLARRTSDNGYCTPRRNSQHATIASIAPTLLKTTPTSSRTDMSGLTLGEDGTPLIGANGGEDQFAGWAWGIGGKTGIESGGTSTDESLTSDSGDSSAVALPRRRSWASDGHGFPTPTGINPAALYAAQQNGFAHGAFGMGKGVDDDGQGSEGTPVELVYVPPFEYAYEEVFEDEDVLLEEEEGDQEVYRYSTVTGSVGPATVSPIPIQNSSIPRVVVDAGQTLSVSASTSAPSKRTRRRSMNVDVEEDREEDAYDYFEGPDLGDDYYYYARRGGRGDHDYGSSAAGRGVGGRATTAYKSSVASGPTASSVSNPRQLERQHERKRVGNGQERQSRSRSESRTPSPAMMISTSPTFGVMRNGSNSSLGSAGRKRGSSTSSPTPNGMIPAAVSTAGSLDQELLSPPTRGRTSNSPPTCQNSGGAPVHEERRGRSSARTSPSSSSWTSSSVGSNTSPMGSLSPDGSGTRNTTSLGIGAVLRNGRVSERENASRGTERRGRERTSSKNLSAASTPVSSPPRSAIIVPPQQKQKPIVDMTASMMSTASTSSSSSSTAMPPSTISPSHDEDEIIDLISESPELLFMRRAEEDLRKRAQTPSNSPIVEMRMANWAIQGPTVGSPSNSTGSRTPTTSSVSEGEVLSTIENELINPANAGGMVSQASWSQQRAPLVHTPKLRPPSTLNPSPPVPSRPKTSEYTAAVNPGPSSPASNCSPLATPTTTTTTSSPTTPGHHDATIVGKAVDIVSSAGAFFGLWGHIHPTPTDSPTSGDVTEHH